MPRFTVVAGDVSGDQHAAAVVAEVLRRAPDAVIEAVGGPALAAVSPVFRAEIVSLSGFGFLAPVRLWRTLRRVLREIERSWDVVRPDAVLLVDYYGFNIHVARAAKRRGLRVIYYVSPQVWASRAGRVRQLRAAVDRMLVILPFEESIYRAAGVPVQFVGNPLLERIPEPGQVSAGSATVGLFPGSRWSVVKRHLPIMEETVRLLRNAVPGLHYRYFLPVSVAGKCPALSAPVTTDDPGLAQRSSLSLAITTSGTVSMENALLGIPMLVMYRLSWPNYLLARLLVRVPYIAMVNILARAEVVPEFIQSRARPELLVAAAAGLLRDAAVRNDMSARLLSFRQSLGSPGASRRVADALMEVA